MSVMFNCTLEHDTRVWPRKSLAFRSAELLGEALVEHSYAAELLVALFEEPVDRHVLELAKIAQQIALEDIPHLPWIAVGGAQRLGDDVVDDPQPEQVARGQPQGLSGEALRLVVGFLPQDARTALRTDD